MDSATIIMSRLKLTHRCCWLPVILLFSGILLSHTVQAERWTADDDSNHWLLDADSDHERFRRLEQHLGGFSHSMREVGFRYRYTYQAITEGNYELARYHWEKIRSAIEQGFLKRPKRRANSQEKFLDTAWPALQSSLQTADMDQIRADFKQARKACMECHKAENKAFLNDQGLFDHTAEFPRL